LVANELVTQVDNSGINNGRLKSAGVDQVETNIVELMIAGAVVTRSLMVLPCASLF
jgi:hypothetical protein